MSTFIIVLVVIMVLIYIGHKAFSSSTDGFANSNPQLDSSSCSSGSKSVPTLYVFKSTTCPACQMYNSGNGPIIRKAIQELGLQIKEVDLDSKDKQMYSVDKNVYDKCDVQYIPTACLVKSNGDIKQLGNGNGINKEMIMDALKN